MTGYNPIPFGPVSPALALYPEFVRDKEVTLNLTQLPRSLSGSDFAIKEQDGAQVFQCTGVPLRRGDRKSITTMDGRMLYTISNKGIYTKVFSAENDQGEALFTIRQSGFRANFEISFTNVVTNKDASLRLKGNIWASQAAVATVTSGNDSEDTTIAQIKRDIWSKEDILLNRRHHTLTIAPGVDVSLLVAICMCFDECKNEPRPHSLGL